MEKPQGAFFEKRIVDENTVVWLSGGEEVARVEIDDAKGIRFWSRRGIITELEDRMREENSGSMYLNEKLEADEGSEVYLIRPGHNWNVSKIDFVGTADHWLNPL